MDINWQGFIAEYGYWAIFILVFLQEAGLPNPIPNELVLGFSGFLSTQNRLEIPFIIATLVTADLLGSTILYTFFYFLSDYYFEHKKTWMPFDRQKMELARKKIEQNGMWSIYLSRVTPLLRGYISISAAVFKISPIRYLPIVIITSIIWCCTFIFIGIFLGNQWAEIEKNFHYFAYVVVFIFILLLAREPLLKMLSFVLNKLKN